MLRKLHKNDIENISMPNQIKNCLEQFFTICIELIDYDYIGDAKEADYEAFATRLNSYLNFTGSCFMLVLSNEIKDSKILRKAFRFDLSEYSFKNTIDTWCFSITDTSVVFFGLIPIKTSEDLKNAVHFLFSGVYDSHNFILYSEGIQDKTEIMSKVKDSLYLKHNRYNYIQDVCISLPALYQKLNKQKILYPYGGTDFGSFLKFIL